MDIDWKRATDTTQALLNHFDTHMDVGICLQEKVITRFILERSLKAIEDKDGFVFASYGTALQSIKDEGINEFALMIVEGLEVNKDMHRSSLEEVRKRVFDKLKGGTHGFSEN